MPTAPVPGTEEDPDFYPPFPETTLADPLPGSAPEDSDYRLRWRQVAVLLMMALALSLAYIVLITKEPKR